MRSKVVGGTGGCPRGFEPSPGKRAVRPLFKGLFLLAILFASLHHISRATSSTSTDTSGYAACKECHGDVHTGSMSFPYRHTVVGERCGVCHLITERDLYPWAETSSSDFRTEALFPLKLSGEGSVYIAEVTARDSSGKKSRPKEVLIDPSRVDESLSPDSGINIGGIRVEEVRQGVFPEAVISWTTGGYASSAIEYGTTEEYGEMSAYETVYSKEHRLTLSMLKKDTLYHYRVVAGDVYGNVVRSDDRTFTTAGAAAGSAAPEKDRTYPMIKDARPLKAEGKGVFILIAASEPVRLTVKVTEKEEEEARHGRGFLSPRASQIDVCAECHPQGTSHPVGIKAETAKTRIPPNLPTIEGGIITCVTCHYPHGGDKEYFARLDFERDICIDCHFTAPYI